MERDEDLEQEIEIHWCFFRHFAIFFSERRFQEGKSEDMVVLCLFLLFSASEVGCTAKLDSV
jgi:hypothetical protein